MAACLCFKSVLFILVSQKNKNAIHFLKQWTKGDSTRHSCWSETNGKSAKRKQHFRQKEFLLNP